MRLPDSVALLCTLLVFDLPARSAGRADEMVRAPAIKSPEQPALVIRSHDDGMSHAVNMGLARPMDSGLPLSVSVMIACPWYQETVDDALRDQNVQLLT